MLPQVPEPDRHHRLAQVAVSPSAGVAAAAGAGLGVLLDPHTFVLAVVLGAGAWAVRVGVAMLGGWRRRLPIVDIDPWAVPEPWRQYVRQAVSARERFEQALGQWPPGPLHDRLVALQPQLQRSAQEAWAVARQGAILDGSAIGTASAGGKRPSVEELSAELRQVQAKQRRHDPAAASRRDSLDRTEAAVAAELRAATRSREAATEALNRLRLLTARLDEAVTGLLSLGMAQADSSSEPAALAAGSVDGVVDELAALHQGLIAASEASSSAAPLELGRSGPGSGSGPGPGPGREPESATGSTLGPAPGSSTAGGAVGPAPESPAGPPPGSGPSHPPGSPAQPPDGRS